jgi:hypothetical protein
MVNLGRNKMLCMNAKKQKTSLFWNEPQARPPARSMTLTRGCAGNCPLLGAAENRR